MDRLARRGVLFTSAHCAAPLCNPSRTALMTGIRPSDSGVYKNSQPFRQSPVLKNAVTIPQHFRASGYRAIGAGKIYHTPFPDPQSWDEYYPSQTRNKPPDPLPSGRPLNGIPKTAFFDWGPLSNSDSEMGDSQVVDFVRGQLSAKQEKPFFLACGIYKPHLPWYVPKKYFDLYPLDRIELPAVKDDDLSDVPPIGKDFALRGRDHEKVLKYNQWRQAVQGYLASISFADAQLGRVLDALDSSPHAGNTSVVLWSDHGWHLGEKLHWRKFTLWERSTRNVLMIAAPEANTGSVCHRTVGLIDIYPTLVEMCGLPRKPGLAGRSLMPLLRDPNRRWDHPLLTTYLKGNHAIRSDRWRYIRYRDNTEELYNRDTDPNEWSNVADRPEYAPIKKQLAAVLPTADAPDSPESTEQEDGEPK